MKRLFLLLIVAAAAALFFGLGLNDYLTLEYVKGRQAELSEFHRQAPLMTAALFFALYLIVTAVSLPGAAILTLAGGGLFGLVHGTVLVSFASSLGATLAFLISRYVFREGVQTRFAKQLKAVDAGVAKDGGFYLFTLRLIPVFPFFLINILMGLTALRARTFYWVSQIGMLPGTLVYVNAGTQLAEVEGLGDIASPALLASFAMLGVFPWIARGVLNWLTARKVYRGYARPKRFDRNIVVIGAGAAGLVSAYIAAAVKAKVTLVESHKMGGDCLNFGCVPSKALIKCANTIHQIRGAARYGVNAEVPAIDFRAVMQRVADVITAIEPHDSIERYTGLGVDVVQGHATIIDPWTAEIQLADGGERRLTARSIVIAAGARPFVPNLPGLADSGFVTSDTMWDRFSGRDSPPRRLIVLGGGPIGCELAQAFARLGSEVTQVEMADRLLVREDPEVSEAARAALAASGVRVLTSHKALEVDLREAGKSLVVESAGTRASIAFDEILVAVGRSARLTGYGLENLGIETSRTITTNEYLQTRFPNIFAAGDVAGPYQFTHVAAHQAWYASVNALFGFARKFKVDYRVIPWVTFTDPEIARVGLNEQEAREQGVPHEVTRFPLHDLDRAIADGATDGFVKVLTAPGKDRILGATIVGAHAGELLPEFVLAMKHGLGLNKILGTIHSYPTLSEANKYAAGEWKRAHAPQGVLRLLARFHAWRRG
jgi:pyruvate/2-oxoglutarate dehydrogenase complex dihydrolipoamide dehydrogenase (E3) component/uncharacterized membrane protein YdjX (TVP38/TMEM64 family)